MPKKKKRKGGSHAAYIKSATWRNKRAEWLERYPDCYKCGTRTPTGMCVHHIRYSRPFGEGLEPDRDLLTLCWKCHNALHGEKTLKAEEATRQFFGGTLPKGKDASPNRRTTEGKSKRKKRKSKKSYYKSSEYNKYRGRKAWLDRRAQFLKDFPKCFKCKKAKGAGMCVLHVHRPTKYDGKEPNTDLVTLCGPCNRKFQKRSQARNHKLGLAGSSKPSNEAALKEFMGDKINKNKEA